MFITVIGALNEGFTWTLALFAVTLLGALPLGLVISLGSISAWTPFRFLLKGNPPRLWRRFCEQRPISLICRLLIWVIRGTPLMLQLYIIFFIPGMVLPSGNPWPAGSMGRFMAASAAFIINYSCYFAEIYRGGIQGVPAGQQEAGLVLGMTRRQIFFKVTLLQMVKRIVPPMSNEIITLVKDTSLAQVISIQELIWAGEAFLKSSHGYKGLLWPLFFTGVYYLLFNGLLTVLFGRLEKKLDYFK